MTALTVGLGLIGIGFLLALLGSGALGRRSAHTFQKKPLLTNNEKEFFQRLKRAVPEYEIFVQVSMGALMTGKHQSGNHIRTRARFAQKIVDFVVATTDGDALLLIELDDRTHNKNKDRQRDQMTYLAGYKTLRFESRAKPSVVDLRNQVLKAVSSTRK